MPWGIAATALVGIYSANKQSKAAKQGADAQAAANQAAIDEQRRQYDLSRSDMQPFLDTGYGALDRQEAFLNGDWSGFESSPDYLWAVDQGLAALDRSQASKGNLYSGGTDADRIALGEGLATQYANNYWAKLAGQANQSYGAASNLGQLGAQSAGTIGNALIATGKARDTAYGQSADAWSGAAAGIGGAFNNWWQGRDREQNT